MRHSSSSLGNLQQEELWHACAGPLVSLPPVGSRVVYFPQGHSEQVAALNNKVIEIVPGFPSLPPQLVCQLHDVTMHADEETDEVYAQMTLQTLSLQEQNDLYLPTELGMRSKHPTNYFRKTLTASDTSTHGCCSIPRRAAEKVLPPLDFSQETPAQELTARDLHGNEWKFRHTFRGQPKRHLLTIGWTVFVNAKRLVAGDSVIFICYGYNELLLGISRARRTERVIPIDSIHVGLVAAHAAATNTPFTISYFPRVSPSEFVIPLAKHVKAVLHTRLFVSMRFRMLFEMADSSVRRYMGKIVGIGDLDPVHWPNSHWRSVKVSWDEPTMEERQLRVSPWEIEPLTTFPMYPSLGIKQPWPTGVTSHHGEKDDDMDLTSQLMSFQNGGNLGFQPLNVHSTSVTPWMLQRRFGTPLLQADMCQTMAAAGVEEKRATDTAEQASSELLQLQQSQTTASNRSSPALQSQTPQNLLQIVQVNQVQGQPQSESDLHHLPQGCSLVEQQQQEPQQQALAAVAPPVHHFVPTLFAYADLTPVPGHDKACHSLPIALPLPPSRDSCSIFQNSNDTLPAAADHLPIFSLSSTINLGLHHSHSPTSDGVLPYAALESLLPPEVCIHHGSVNGHEFITKNNERFFF